MRPARVEDLDAVGAILASAPVRVDRLPSVTFVAYRSEKPIGLLGFTWDDGYPVAGPLITVPEERSPRFIVHRLVGAMERWIAAAGVTRYLFEIPKDNARMARAALKAGAVVTGEEKASIWYAKEVGHGPA